MVLLVQLVFLIDTNCTNIYGTSKEDLERYQSKLLLCCLRLMTEFGARTDKGCEQIRWSFKFYDSRRFKSDISHKVFLDFSKGSIEKFHHELKKILDQSHSIKCKRADAGHQANKVFSDEDGASQPGVPSKSNGYFEPENNSPQHQHSYILNKCLQEILLDYDWDRPNISSPVRKASHKSTKNKSTKLIRNDHKQSQLEPENNPTDEQLNFVIVFTTVPHNLEETSRFIDKNKSRCCASDFFQSIFDQATLQGFKDEKNLRFHLVNISKESVDASLAKKFQKDLIKLKGGLHELSNLVQGKDSRTFLNSHKTEGNKRPFNNNIFHNDKDNSSLIKGTELPINCKNWWTESRCTRNDKHPTFTSSLIWENEDGTSFLKIPLEFLSIHGSSKKWPGDMYVKSFIRDTTLSLVGSALPLSRHYICHSSSPSFEIMLSVLSEQNLTMFLQLECEGLACLVPWTGGLAYLIEFSATNMRITDELSREERKCIQKNITDQSHLCSIARKCIVACLNKAPEMEMKQRFSSHRWMQPQALKTWYPPLQAHLEHLPKRSREKGRQQAMYERLQKKYRPQMPRPLSESHLPPPALVDVTEPAAAAADPTVPGTISAKHRKHNVSRAQTLVKKSKIITAQMKVKEQKLEEQEQQAQSERKMIEALNREKKSQALVTKSLNSINNPQDKDEVACMLITLRDNADGGREDNEDTQNAKESSDEDLFATVQALINLTLSHIRTYFNRSSVQDELNDVLSRGVLLASKDVATFGHEKAQCRQFKVQVMLRLEILWILGYSPTDSSSLENTEMSQGNATGERFVDEILRLLRAMSLRHDPSVVGEFLQKIVAPNYCEFLGETLVEILEELNQPLPNCLSRFAKHDNEEEQSPCIPSSVKSQASSLHSNGPRSTDDGLLIPKDNNSKATTRPVIRRETSNRQIIVPHVRRPSRKTNQDKPQRKKDHAVKSVCRNLFAKGGMKRSHTFNTFDNASKSPSSKSKRTYTARTPQRQRKSEQTASSSSARKTSRKEQSTTPVTKTCKVLAPETPSHSISTTIFNRLQLRKSTGSTFVAESPEIKGLDRRHSLIRKHSLPLTRRRSFYSGDVSRNFEKGKQQLMASHLKATVERKSSLAKTSSSSNSSFLFSEIIQSNQAERKMSVATRLGERSPVLPEAKRLKFGLDDDDEKAEIFNTDMAVSGSKNDVSPNTREKDLSPLKRVKRSLSLTTPVKAPMVNGSTPVKSNEKELQQRSQNITQFNLTERPEERLCDAEKRLLKEQFFSCLTPSKRVQFNLDITPYKATHAGKVAVTPKSILKTPSKSPHKTPIKIDSMKRWFTPVKAGSMKEDFSPMKCDSTKKQITPAKIDNIKKLLTPMKAERTPVKSRSGTPNQILSSRKTTRNELVAKSNSETVTPTQKENKFPSKIVTQFRNTTPSQFELLLNSPITSSMKKRKSSKETPSSLASDTGIDGKNKRKALSPSNSPFKICKTPSKGESNWDFKPLVDSPVKYLLNSCAEFEVTSPVKNSATLTKADVVLHEAVNDDLMVRDVTHGNEEEPYIKEMPLEQIEPADVPSGDNKYPWDPEGVDILLKETVLCNRETDSGNVSDIPSQTDITTTNAKEIDSCKHPVAETTGNNNLNVIDSCLTTSVSDLGNMKINRVSSNESQSFVRSRKIFQIDSDSGISMTAQSEDRVELENSDSLLTENINNLISSLVSPVKEPVKTSSQDPVMKITAFMSDKENDLSFLGFTGESDKNNIFTVQSSPDASCENTISTLNVDNEGMNYVNIQYTLEASENPFSSFKVESEDTNHFNVLSPLDTAFDNPITSLKADSKYTSDLEVQNFCDTPFETTIRSLEAENKDTNSLTVSYPLDKTSETNIGYPITSLKADSKYTSDLEAQNFCDTPFETMIRSLEAENKNTSSLTVSYPLDKTSETNIGDNVEKPTEMNFEACYESITEDEDNSIVSSSEVDDKNDMNDCDIPELNPHLFVNMSQEKQSDVISRTMNEEKSSDIISKTVNEEFGNFNGQLDVIDHVDFSGKDEETLNGNNFEETFNYLNLSPEIPLDSSVKKRLTRIKKQKCSKRKLDFLSEENNDSSYTINDPPENFAKRLKVTSDGHFDRDENITAEVPVESLKNDDSVIGDGLHYSVEPKSSDINSLNSSSDRSKTETEIEVNSGESLKSTQSEVSDFGKMSETTVNQNHNSGVSSPESFSVCKLTSTNTTPSEINLDTEHAVSAIYPLQSVKDKSRLPSVAEDEILNVEDVQDGCSETSSAFIDVEEFFDSEDAAKTSETQRFVSKFPTRLEIQNGVNNGESQLEDVIEEPVIEENSTPLDPCTPRRSTRTRKPTERFESPINSSGCIDFETSVSPVLKSRRKKTTPARRNTNRQLYNTQSPAQKQPEDDSCYLQPENQSHVAENSTNRVTPPENVVAPIGRLSDSFEIVSPIKKQTETRGETFCDDDSSHSVASDTRNKSPIILRIRKKRKLGEMSRTPARASKTLALYNLELQKNVDIYDFN